MKSNNGRVEDLYEFPVHRTTECARIGSISYLFNIDGESLCLRFREESDLKRFHSIVNEAKVGKSNSVFSERTDDSSAVQYFQFYGYLSQQQNMLQDYVRTSTYQRAVLANSDDFRDKVVLDVGAGSGILSFFSVQAGAKRVYAVEASSMAQHAESSDIDIEDSLISLTSRINSFTANNPEFDCSLIENVQQLIKIIDSLSGENAELKSKNEVLTCE
ncbi:Histone-arginine methyltransferase carm1 [Homalodisca vitripennis]|nr:Histone-arginine methyltransferase carm1 [Homalodisca vitripennis]